MNRYLITKKWSLLGLVFVAGTLYAQSNSENYVYSKTYLADPTTTNAKTSETVTYFDGLGRAKQIVSIKATPSGKDMVTPVTYDGFGRQTKNILPTPINTLNGNIHSGVTNENTANSYYGVSNAYSEKELEKSPLDRVLQQANPGDAWKLGAGHTQTFTYGTNAANEVIKFVTTTSTSTVSNVTTISTALPVGSLGFYGQGRFYKNTITDEDGNPVTQFTNGRGQTILIRRTDGTQNIDTYYVYNDYGQKAFVIPPKAVKQIVQNANKVTADILNELCYQYRYDGQGREVEKKLPGKGWELTIYDKQDRAVLYQDAVLGTVNNNFGSKGWIFTKYDEFDRVVYTGFLSSSATRQSLQNTLNTLATNASNNEKRTSTFFNQQGIDIYYDKLAYPTANFVVLSVNYYDSYPRDAPAVIPEKILDQYVLLATFGTSNTTSTKSLKTASYLKNIEDDKWTKTYHYYDFKGRQIATKTTNHLEGYTNKEFKLDFSGLATESYTYHKRTPTDTEVKIKESFIYDNGKRILKQYHQVDNLAEELLAENTYNDLGQLTKKKTGNTTGIPLQSIDYTYNIRGWLTSINNPNNQQSFTGKLFGLQIKYDNPTNALAGIAKFNGNISQTDWKTTNDGVLRRYTYGYDKLDRLASATYAKPGSTVENTMAYDEWAWYDENGNIRHIDRYGGMDGNQAQMIDELEYEYVGNRLVKAFDNIPNPSGYPSGGNDISYDLNGNMIDHKDKNINKIIYNYLNLPINVDMVQGGGFGIPGEGNRIGFKYKADGVKVEKNTDYVNPYSTDITNTNYLDGFQYERRYTKVSTSQTATDSGYLLQFFPTSEGYFDFQKKRYIYNYEDQVGNVRLSYYKNALGQAVIDKENNYYPFGLEHSGYNSGTSQLPTYRYGYNRKEKQNETGWNDYGGRMYNSDLGRWLSPDLLSEEFSDVSTYNYALNNPLRYKDPDGNAPEDAIDGDGCCQHLKGFALTMVDNVIGSNFRNTYASNSESYRNGVNNAHGASIALGAFMIIDGGANIGGGTAGLVASGTASATGVGTVPGGIGAAASGIAIAKGTAELAGAGYLLKNTINHMKSDNSKSNSGENAKSLIRSGRAGKQDRLKQLSEDPKLGKADKGWIKSEINQIKNGKRKTIRNPPGKDLAHERGREAAKGYSYEYSNLQNRKDHRNQHKYDNGGRKNKERPVN